jgi:hypothetical protein
LRSVLTLIIKTNQIKTDKERERETRTGEICKYTSRISRGMDGVLTKYKGRDVVSLSADEKRD